MGTSTLLAALCASALLVCAVQGDKLKVGFYSEGLCPYCAMYMDNYILPMSEEGIMEYVDFKMIPAGNTYVNQTTGKVECQHGPDECYLNKMLNCGIAAAATQKQAISFVACIESVKQHVLDRPKLAKKCAKKNGLHITKVKACAAGDQGEELFKQAMEMTADLKVPHEWVPWVVIEGIPLYGGLSYLRTVICVSIPAEERPKECYADPDPDTGDSGAKGFLAGDNKLPKHFTRANLVA